MYVRTCHHHHRRHHRRHQIYHHHQHHQHQQLLGLISTLSSIILISSIYSTSSSPLINNQHRRIVLFCPWLSTCNNRPAPATSGAYEVRSACHPPHPRIQHRMLAVIAPSRHHPAGYSPASTPRSPWLSSVSVVAIVSFVIISRHTHPRNIPSSSLTMIIFIVIHPSIYVLIHKGPSSSSPLPSPSPSPLPSSLPQPSTTPSSSPSPS